MAVSPYASMVVIPETIGNNIKIIDFLEKRFSRISRRQWETRIQAGKVLDGEFNAVTLESCCVPRSRVYYFREVTNEPLIPFQEEILFQDDHLLVVCKPHFLPVTPGGRHVNETLLNRLKQKTGNPFLSPINRIDRETAGLVLFSVQKKTRGLYQLLYMQKKIIKTYEALTLKPEGLMPGRWLIQNRMVKGEPWFRMKIETGAVNAVTIAEMVEVSKNRALFRLTPDTGKKHQLRLHLSTLQCPIINDRYYPELLPETAPDFNNPLQLLAKEVCFVDPVSNIKRQFISQRRLKPLSSDSA